MRVGYQDHEAYIKPVSEALTFGTLVHYLIEQDLRVGERRLDMLSNMSEWVEPILVEQYDWSLSQVPNVPQFLSEISVAYRTWATQVLPRLNLKKLVALEPEMMTYLGEGRRGNIFLQGTADQVYSTYLRDLKTARSGWKLEKAELSIQASLYPALVKDAFGISVQKFIFDVYNKSKSLWDSYERQTPVKVIDAALETAYRNGLKLEAGIFTAHPVPESSFSKKRGWYCSPKFCPAWNACTMKYLVDDVDESQLAIRSWN